MDKIDLLKTDAPYYKASKEPDAIDLPAINYLSVAGKGAPEGETFANAMQALYAGAYGIKALKKKEGMDFKVPKMEGFWWSSREDKNLQNVPREEWRWTLLIRMPDDVAKADLEKIRSEERKFSAVTWHTESSGLFTQILHIGSYDEEDESIGKLLWWVKHKGYQIAGKHREIYLSDPRRTPAEKLKTILRYRIN